MIMWRFDFLFINLILSLLNIFSLSKVGIHNLGNTCYLNSVIQNLYHAEDFRNQIICNYSNDDSSSICALKNIFNHLNQLITANPIKLIEKCGVNIGVQEDAQEFLLKLFENLEKDIALVDGKSPLDVFTGRSIQYISCKNVNYRKEREEKFYDISLDISESSDIIQALHNFFSPVELIGENMYKTPDYGKQDAIKGQYISNLPDVLHIHLKRFSYDFNTDIMKKISKRVTFPLTLDMKTFMDPEGANQQDTDYELNSVILHEGDVNYGHYFCYARPDHTREPDKWLKFNDQIVTEVSAEHVLEEGYGEEKKVPFFMGGGGSKSAYILQYAKKSNTK